MMVKSLNHLGVVLAAVAAGVLAAGGSLLLMLLVVVEPAGAAFPGQNGKIAFIASRPATGATFNYEIYTVNANGYPGTGLVRLTNNAASDTGPAWSPVAPIPGGNKIAFSSDRDGNRGDIYTMNPSAMVVGPHGLIFTPTDRLTETPTVWEDDPAWSPDGTKIAFVSDRGPGWDEIYTMHSNDGTAVHRVTNMGSLLSHMFVNEPDWQPLQQTPVFPVRQLHHTATATATASAAGAAQYQYASALPGTGGVVSPVTLLAIIPAMLLVGGGLLSARLIRRS